MLRQLRLNLGVAGVLEHFILINQVRRPGDEQRRVRQSHRPHVQGRLLGPPPRERWAHDLRRHPVAESHGFGALALSSPGLLGLPVVLVPGVVVGPTMVEGEKDDERLASGRQLARSGVDLRNVLGVKRPVIHPHLINEAVEAERGRVVAHCASHVRADLHRLGRLLGDEPRRLSGGGELAIHVQLQLLVGRQHAGEVGPFADRHLLLSADQAQLVGHAYREVGLAVFEVKRIAV